VGFELEIIAPKPRDTGLENTVACSDTIVMKSTLYLFGVIIEELDELLMSITETISDARGSAQPENREWPSKRTPYQIVWESTGLSA
jgi:hypothetical protein